MILGVNIDHIATIRNARGEADPSLTAGAHICELSGADGITVHLREDRRHIKDKDLYLLKDILRLPLNLEMALNEDVLEHAIKSLPRMCTLVPEKREEITTEGGLEILSNVEKIKEYTGRLHEKGILVSLFIEADNSMLDVLNDIRPDFVEIHTGKYARNYYNEMERFYILKTFEKFTQNCIDIGIRVNAGHGLNYQNTSDIVKINGIEELNIGHAIIARAVFSGLGEAVREMKNIINSGRI
ncbi:MAG: pyridoxine 5'-phosphate synthase [Candidatus Muirbacterium halophilum]|nr:pyridoxine 5'-phosphate synthase [Candidatus Muirbacterium halophilum]MCK9477346.1 pyridoxine 5'-phosphate synthase [Candidatus Muirbacterium halophilum]